LSDVVVCGQVAVVAKALVRLLRSHYEVQAIVLNSIAAMTIQETTQNSIKLLMLYWTEPLWGSFLLEARYLFSWFD